MYLLDTNIVSMLDPKRHAKAPGLIDWLKRNGVHLYISVMTIAEMEAGILKLRRKNDKRRADALAHLVVAIIADFEDRVLPIDLETAKHIARLGELTHKKTVELPDLVIAATAARHDLTILTRNLKDVGRLAIPARDPFVDLPPDV